MIEDEDIIIEMFGGKLMQDGYDVVFRAKRRLGGKRGA